MGAVSTLMLIGFIALALAAPDLMRAFARDADPNSRNENVRKVQRWTLIFEVGLAVTAWVAAALLRLSNMDLSAATTDHLLRATLATLVLVGMPGAYGYLSLRQWQLRKQHRSPDGTLSAEDARRISSLDRLKNLFLAMMALALLLLLVLRQRL